MKIDNLRSPTTPLEITELSINIPDLYDFALAAVYDRFIFISGGKKRLDKSKKESKFCVLIDTVNDCKKYFAPELEEGRWQHSSYATREAVYVYGGFSGNKIVDSIQFLKLPGKILTVMKHFINSLH